MALTLSRTQGEGDGLGVGDGGRDAPGNSAEAVAKDEVGEAWLGEVTGLLD